jgi:hypothetical protein
MFIDRFFLVEMKCPLTNMTDSLPRILQTKAIRYMGRITPAIPRLHCSERRGALVWYYECYGVELCQSALHMVVRTC